jgi:hypothetical protein
MRRSVAAFAGVVAVVSVVAWIVPASALTMTVTGQVVDLV